ncbi:MAG: ACT domain-containing protein [Candidatus Micrarchaeota archaeon]
MKQLTIRMENKVGELARVCEVLGSAGVNLRSISAQGEGSEGVVRLITEDEKTAMNTLKKNGFNAIASDTVILSLTDKPGELAKATKRLASAGVNIHSVYLLGKEGGKADLVITADNLAAAMSALRK